MQPSNLSTFSNKAKLSLASVGLLGLVLLLTVTISMQRQEQRTKAATQVTLEKAINFNGPSIVVDGVNFLSESSAGVQHLGSLHRFENQGVTLNPSVSSTKAQMIRSSIWYTPNFNVPVSNGSYQVYIYNWEDTTNGAQTFSYTIEGTTAGSNINSGSIGTWKKLGPYNVAVNDGNITLKQTSGGDFNLSGMEIYKITTVADTATPTPIPTATPTPKPTATPVPLPTATPTPKPTATPTPALTGIVIVTATPFPTTAPTATPVVATNTPAPTATPVAGSTIAKVTLMLHGIGKGGDSVNPNSTGNLNPLHPQRTVTVDIYDVQNQLVTTKQGTVSYNATAGNFVGNVDLGTQFVSGIYTVKVKTDKYLRGLVTGIQTITKGQTATMPSVALVNGDVNNDNQINIVDYNIIVGCYSDLLPAVDCNDAKKDKSDLNDDGNVNQFDYNLFVRELTNIGGQ